jgi:hypothetical protein
MIKHIPSLIGVTILFGICYILAYVPLTGAQLFSAIAVLVLIYSATVFWYVRMTL